MALIAVAQPGQRETQLDAIAKALNIAQSIYGIKTASEQMDLQRAREARMAEAEKAQEARAQEQFGIVKEKNAAEMAMLKTGAMTPKQFNDEYFEVDKNEVGKINDRFKGLVPIINAKVWKYGAKEGEKNYEERIAIPRDVYSRVLQSMADERKTQMLIQGKVDEKAGKLDLTPGQEKADKDFASLYDGWTSGENETFQKNINLLESSLSKLQNWSKIIPASGRFAGRAPDLMKSDAAKVIMQNVRQSAQGALKATLGSQFTDREGERIMNAAYDPTLGPEENMQKIKTALNELYGRKKALENKGRYWEQQGTLKGFKYFDKPSPLIKSTTEKTPLTTGGGQPLLPNQSGYTTDIGKRAAIEIGVD